MVAESRRMKEIRYWGTTFSHRFAKELELDPHEALHQVIALNFDLVRLCVCWDEVQPHDGAFEFEEYHRMLQLCQERGQNLVLAVGMKAPRWPEFYIPAWLPQDPNSEITQHATLNYLEQITKEFQRYQNIFVWQIENEPLDSSGPEGWKIPEGFLAQEVELVRGATDKPVLLTAWGNELRKRGNLSILQKSGTDILGIDLYYQQFVDRKLFGAGYVGPQDSAHQLYAEISRTRLPSWVAELQAEPWEKNQAAYRADRTKSMSPDLLRQHIDNMKQLPVEAVLFWGVEYWIWRARQGDRRYIDVWNEVRSRS